MRPSGRKVRPQGWSSPRAAVSTMISAFSVLRRWGCCARAGRETTTNATQTRTKQRSMADSQLTPRSSARRPDQEINNLIQQMLGPPGSPPRALAARLTPATQLAISGVNRVDPLRPASLHSCVRTGIRQRRVPGTLSVRVDLHLRAALFAVTSPMDGCEGVLAMEGDRALAERLVTLFPLPPKIEPD